MRTSYEAGSGNKNLKEKKITITICLFENVWFVIPYRRGIVMIVTVISARFIFKTIRKEECVDV